VQALGQFSFYLQSQLEKVIIIQYFGESETRETSHFFRMNRQIKIWLLLLLAQTDGALFKRLLNGSGKNHLGTIIW
jgi:hypothetical protein